MMGFSIKRYGRLDYIVAPSRRFGQGTGEVLVALMMQHRGGSADRVAPDHVQQLYANYIQSVVPMAELLRSMVETIEAMPITRLPAKLKAAAATARDLLGPLPPWDKMVGDNVERVALAIAHGEAPAGGK